MSTPTFPAVRFDPPISDLTESPATLRFRERVRSRVGTAELLAFHLIGERFAFDVRALDEVLDAPPIERLESFDAGVRGLTTHRAKPIPVFDTAHLLGMTTSSGQTVLVMRSGTQRLGLLVDEVDDVITIDLGRLFPPPFEAVDDLLLGVSWSDDELTGILDARALIMACQPRNSLPL